MNDLNTAVERVLAAQVASGKPLAIILAGHNGSGKSTMWQSHLAPDIRIPLINADRMIMSILPEVPSADQLPDWARQLRDDDRAWMAVARESVDSFVVNAMRGQVPFAYETVFSHTRYGADGEVLEDKSEQILSMQRSNYFVVLIFVGLSNANLSVGRVLSRQAQGGHAVPNERLLTRFARTQATVRKSIPMADASLLVDNSSTPDLAFTVCRAQIANDTLFDIRASGDAPAYVVEWLDRVSPQPA